jgi:2,5-diketo-D-gluconate reductase A
VLDDPVVQRIADELGRTPAQVVLRWHVQQGLVAIPKSASPDRMRDNLAIFDFELADAVMTELATLSQGPDAGVDSNVEGH